jgi:hypothetical protein
MKELWYVSCSPRNPAKIKKELALLAKLEGERWNTKDQAGRNSTQLKFAKMLSELPEFEGRAAGKESDFSARDRVAPMKTYGFVYVDKQDRIKVTKAGKALINAEDEEENVFLMQMLKWQYPSAQHSGPQYIDEPATLFEPSKPGFAMFPFIFTLQVAGNTGGITKREIALFLLPQRRMRGLSIVIQKISVYRAGKAKKKGRVNKKKYDDAIHQRLYKRLYSESLLQCKTKEEKQALLRKKISNSLDVADACMRLFRFTGLFATEKDRLVCNKTRGEEIDLILKKKWVPVEYYEDTDRFYQYFGDHEKPTLPFTSEAFLSRRILSLQKEIKKFQIPISKPPEILSLNIQALRKMSKAELHESTRRLRELYRRLAESSITGFLRSPEGQRDVLEFYETIIHREVADPATFFEWNTWRAMIALDDAERIIPYLKMDDTLQPVDCARGNRPDILVEFGDYLLAVEVTLTSGRRQYITETEPVTFHVGKCQHEENISKKGRKVYGLFIAPNIHKHTAHYFHQYIQKMEVPDFGNVTVIPLDLKTWLSVLEFANSIGYVRRHDLGSLLVNIEREGLVAKDGDSWMNAIPEHISVWRDKISKPKSPDSKTKQDSAF